MSNPALRFDHVHIIARDPHATAQWYVDMLGATLKADTMAYGAPQLFLDLGGVEILVRSAREGEATADAKPIHNYGRFASHGEWGTDHFGFLYSGDLEAFCKGLAEKGVEFPVPLKRGVGGRLLCYISAPDNVSIELMEVG
ncbi:MAG: VOC family protein [Proteobacteria bacterium]|nr:VOC family protein [Pseudomonadota bacterium]